jgi:integrase/recombinase XerD
VVGLRDSYTLPKGVCEGLPKPFASVLNSWSHSLARYGAQPRTITEYPAQIARMLRVLFEHYPKLKKVKSLKREHVDFIDEYLFQQEINHVVKRNTRCGYISTMKRFFRWLWGEDLVNNNIGKSLQPVAREEKITEDVYSEKEVSELLGNIKDETIQSKRDYTLAVLIYSLGLRSGSARWISIDDIDWEKKELYVRTIKGAKSDKNNLALCDEVLDMLRAYIDEVRPFVLNDRRGGAKRKLSYANAPSPDKLLFPTSNGLPIDTSNFLKRIKKAGFKAGIKNAKVHGLRHSVATHMVARGCDVLDVNRLLLQKDLSSTMIYIKLDVTRLRSSLENYHPLLNGTMNELRNRNQSVPKHEETQNHQGNFGQNRRTAKEDVWALPNEGCSSPLQDALICYQEQADRKGSGSKNNPKLFNGGQETFGMEQRNRFEKRRSFSG